MPDPNTVTGLYTRTYYTVATLPAAASMDGAILYVTDSNANPMTAMGQVAAGGGTTLCRVKSANGSWRIDGNPMD